MEKKKIKKCDALSFRFRWWSANRFSIARCAARAENPYSTWAKGGKKDKKAFKSGCKMNPTVLIG